MQNIDNLLNKAIFGAAFRTVDSEAAKIFDETIKQLIEYHNNTKDIPLDINTLIIKLVAVKRVDDYIDSVLNKTLQFIGNNATTKNSK